MRRTSLTQIQATQLGQIFKRARHEKGYSFRQLAAKAAVSLSTVNTLERGINRSPSAESVKAVARALDLSVSDVMVTADWLPAEELPSLQPYLRSKYGLTEQEITEVGDYVRAMQFRNGSHGRPGPDPHEDEH